MDFSRMRFVMYLCCCSLYFRTASSLYFDNLENKKLFNTYIPAWDNVKCRYNSAVVISDRSYVSRVEMFRNFMVDYLMTTSLPLTYVTLSTDMNATEISQTVQNVILSDSNQEGLNREARFLYVLVTSEPANILKMVDNYFSQELSIRGSIFVHKSKWLVFVSSQVQRESVVQEQRKSLLDNVVIVYHRDYNDDMRLINGKGLNSFLDIETFMWRENRVRKPQKINISTDQVPDKKCLVFPNIYTGMNERKLVIGFVLLGNESYINYTTKSGIPKHDGFDVILIDLMAKKLNFTYNFTPAANETPWTFEELIEATQNNNVDFTARLWNLRKKLVFNMTFSQPVFHDSFTGIYRREELVINRSELLVLPFSWRSMACVVGSFLFCMVAYSFITILFSSERLQSDEKHTTGLNSRHVKSENESQQTRHRHTRYVTSSNSLLKKFGTNFFSLVTAMFEQSNLPNSKLMSARIILFLLSFSTVVYSAFYTSLLTASMFVITTDNTISNFEDLLATGKYKCSIMADSDGWNLLSDSTDDRVIVKALKNMCKTVRAQPQLQYLIDNLDGMKRHTIWLGSKTHFEKSLKYYQHPEKYAIIRQTLFDNSEAFMFPKNSELAQLFTPIIMQLQNGKIYDKMEETYWTLNLSSTRNYGGNRSAKKQVDISDLTHLAVLALVLTCLSLVVLVGEWVVAWGKYVLALPNNVMEDGQTID